MLFTPDSPAVRPESADPNPPQGRRSCKIANSKTAASADRRVTRISEARLGLSGSRSATGLEVSAEHAASNSTRAPLNCNKRRDNALFLIEEFAAVDAFAFEEHGGDALGGGDVFERVAVDEQQVRFQTLFHQAEPVFGAQ
jgi:hypothetical protein